MSPLRFPALIVLLLFVVMTVCGQSGNQVAKGPTPKTPVPSASKSTTTTTLIDLNSASKKALMELPGISESNAQKIIENRPYHYKTDLTLKNVLSREAYDKIAGRIVARTTVRVSPGNVDKKAASTTSTAQVQRKYQ